MVIGCSGTGKTSFVNRWIKGEFVDTQKPTIISEYGFKIYNFKEHFYRIQLWDIGGQDKSPTMAKIFSRDSHGCFVVSDVTKNNTLLETMNWKKVINDECIFLDGDKLPFILIQNKIDLISDKQELNNIENETKNFSQKHQFNKYFMVSVKNDVNVNESMSYLIENIIDRLEKYQEEGHQVFDRPKRRDTVSLRKSYLRKKSLNKKCC